MVWSCSRQSQEDKGVRRLPRRASSSERQPRRQQARTLTRRRCSLFQNLGNTLALIRNLRRKSQAQVAREAGIGRSKLSRYENGTELPGLDLLGRLLKALDISQHEFLFVLALVDERASLLSSCDASTLRSLLVV